MLKKNIEYRTRNIEFRSIVLLFSSIINLQHSLFTRYLFRAITLWLFIAFSSCQKQTPELAITDFSDDFESYTNKDSLVTTDGMHWTKFNVNEINISSNPVTLDTFIVHSGKKSVRFHCKQSDPAMTEVCKCNLNKNDLYFKQGDIVYYSAWYYIERSDSAYGTFFLWDLEEIAAGTMGIRVMAWEENLELERNKMGLSNLFQEKDVSLFPINRWSHLEIEIKLSQYRTGSVRMWLDGKEIINRHKIRTLPKDQVNLVWGTQGYYDRVQVGITAKGGTEELIMYVDDVVIKKK